MERTSHSRPGPDAVLELDDIQSGVLHERPSPYVGTYLLLRIDDRAAGRELVRHCSRWSIRDGRRRIPPTTPGSRLRSPTRASRRSVSRRTHSTPSRRSSARAWRHAPQRSETAARAARPTGRRRSAPGCSRAIAALSPDATRLEAVLDKARRADEALAGVELIWRQDCYQLPTGRTSFGFKDGIGQPAVEGSGIPPTNPQERPLKAGDIILGYPDETGELPPMPSPDVLGRNGTYVVFRKLHTPWRPTASTSVTRRPAAMTRHCSAPRWWAGGRAAPRWRFPWSTMTPSSALILRATTTSCTATIHAGSVSAGAHARRANLAYALDGEGSVDVRLHRMIRRGTSYGPMLPDGVLDDDGVDRGIMFVFAGAHLGRQFEFVKTQWLNDGIFIGAPTEKDPLVGANDGTGCSRSRAGRSDDGWRTCRRSSSHAAASTASRRACGRCVGSPS